MLVKGGLPLGVEALVVKLHARRVGSVACQDFAKKVVGAPSSGLVEKRCARLGVEPGAVKRVDGALAGAVRAP